VCGPSGQEKQIAGQQASFSNLLSQDFSSRFAGQTMTLSSLGNILSGVSQGKLLPGFDANTLAALNTSAIDTTGANYAKAARATNNQLAGRGGDSGLESGVDAQIKAGIASQGAGQLSTEQAQIQLANQAQAERNTETAIGGYQTLAGIQNPLGFAGATTTAQGQAFGSASAISQQQGQMEADIAGGIVGLGMDAATFGAGAMGGGGLQGGLKSLAG